MERRDKNCSPPAMTPQAREDQLISMAYDAVEERIRSGTATGAELVQVLKWGSTKERLEREILEQQKVLMEAKTDALQSSKRVEELYSEALKAMTSYRGEMSDE